MSDLEVSFSIPLDPDGFLRRECPHCEREFKWRPAESDADDAVPPADGYACPYCAARAPAGHWWTKAQLEHAQRLVASELLGPELKKLERRLEPDSPVSLEVSVDLPEKPEPLAHDDNDMRRVDFACHPSEPIKVLEDWHGVVHCLICAAPAATNRSP